MTQDKFGISGMSVFVPPYRVNLQDWCGWTNNQWDKISAVIGQSFRMAGPEESVYTMAASAVLKLILDYRVDPSRIGSLSLATESSSDNAVGAVIVRGLVDQALGVRGLPPLSRYCEVPEYKQACLSGVYGIKGAMRYLAYDGAGRQAIVVAADIAEYDRGSTGEPTQGAGATAMLIDRDPQLLSLDLMTSGSSSSYRIADFRKPFLRFNGQTPGANGRLRDFPVFNGKYSTACYLDEVVCAFDALYLRHSGPRAEFLRSLAAVFMHRPYHHMPVSAWTMAYLFALGADGGAEHDELRSYCEPCNVRLEQVLAEMSLRPSLVDKVISGHPPEEPYPLTALVMKAFRKSPRYKEVVESKLKLGAAPMMHLGNLYSAALPAWIAAGLEEAHDNNIDLAARKILLVGYGSGDAAETVVAKVSANWRQAAARIGLAGSLKSAVAVGKDDYARLHAAQWPQDAQVPRRSGFTIERVGKSHDANFHDLGLEYYRYTP